MTDLAAVKSALRTQAVETPSWAYGNSGTRFKVFAQQGVPRTPQEKLDDAAKVHEFTGVAPTVALHIPWDKVDGSDGYTELAKHAEDRGVRLGAINSNTFQDDAYKLGSICHPDAAVRRKALDHLLECVDIMDATGSRDLKLWFADGTNYPGQDDLRGRQDRLAEGLAEVYERLGDDQRMLLEYKFFEPAFYATDVPDWGTAYAHCLKLGEKAQVVVDTGHHAPGTNIEFIVATLLREEKLGGFDFNSAVLRGRRPHGRSRRPLPAVPDHVRGRPRRRVLVRGRVHAGPVSQHRGEDPRDHPVRDERPGGHREGAPRGRGGTGEGPAVR
ncbi:Xylose isomerase [Streptomyces alboniger]